MRKLILLVLSLTIGAVSNLQAAMLSINYNVPNTAWANSDAGFVSRALNGSTYMLMGTDGEGNPLKAEALGSNGTDHWCQWAQFGTGNTTGSYTLRYGLREESQIGSPIGEIAAVQLSMKMSAGIGTIKVGVVPEGETEPIWFNGNAAGKNAISIPNDGFHNYFFIADKPVTGVIVMEGDRNGAIQIQKIEICTNFSKLETPATLNLAQDSMYDSWYHFDNVVIAKNSDMMVSLTLTKGTEPVAFNDYLGCNWGSSASPIGEGDFQLSLLPAVTDLTVVELNALTPNGGTGEFAGATVGDTDLTVIPSALTETATDYNFASTKAVSGQLIVTGKMTDSNKKFFKLNSIKFTFDHNQTTTGIEEISIAPELSDEQAYDIYGRPVDDSYKGLVIYKGRKVLRR